MNDRPDADVVILDLTKRLNAYLEAESEKGFAVLMSALSENPPTSVTIAQPFGVSAPPSSGETSA